MLTPFFALYLTGILVVRFLFLAEARAIRRDALMLYAVGVAAVSLCYFAPDGFWFGATIAHVVLTVLILLRAERHGQEASGTRLLLLALHLGVGVVLARHQGAVDLGPAITRTPPVAILWIAGGLLCFKESNFFIRWFFTRIKPRPGNNELNTEQKFRSETGHGRTIGSLERLLVYVLLLPGQTMAVPVVVAVKALARFKRMEDDQTFAEYVIIGTFLSLLLALAAFGFVHWAG